VVRRWCGKPFSILYLFPYFLAYFLLTAENAEKLYLRKQRGGF
jgi:hypothetical protein